MPQLFTGAPVGALAHLFPWLLASSVLLVGACARPITSGDSTISSAQPPSALKSITIGTIREPTQGLILFAGTGLLTMEHTWVFHTGLTAFDPRGNLLPRIAQKVPTIRDGDWQIAPDGSMTVTWQLRPDVKWHDGKPLVADDFVFGVQALRDPGLSVSRQDGISLITSAEAPNPRRSSSTGRSRSMPRTKPTRSTCRRCHGISWAPYTKTAKSKRSRTVPTGPPTSWASARIGLATGYLAPTRKRSPSMTIFWGGRR